MPRRRYKIVHFDDEYVLGTLLCSEFRSRGYEAFYVPSKVQGIAWAKRHRPDLIISDIRSPEMDGMECLKELRSQSATSTTPFIFLTGCDDLKIAQMAVTLGADDFVTKPFDIEVVVQCIERVLGQRNSPIEEPGARSLRPVRGFADTEWPELASLFKAVLTRFASRATVTGQRSDWQIDFLFEHEQTLFGGMFWHPLEFGVLRYEDIMAFRTRLDTDGLDFGLLTGFHAIDREKLAFGRMLGIEILSQEETEDLLHAGRRSLWGNGEEPLVERLSIPVESLYESRKINRFLKTAWNEMQLLQGECINPSRRSSVDEGDLPKPAFVTRISAGSISIQNEDGSGYTSVDKTDCVRTLMELWAKESLTREELIVPEYTADDLFHLLSSLPYVNLRDNRINLHPAWKHRRRR